MDEERNNFVTEKFRLELSGVKSSAVIPGSKASSERHLMTAGKMTTLTTL